MATLILILLILAILLLGLAAFNVSSPINLQAAGLALFVLAFTLSTRAV